jgi:photosystem II stability/assembly factor-like uncharacterized protein
MAWLHSVFFIDENRGWAVGGKGALLKTDDGGRTWQTQRRPTDDSLRDVFFVDADTGWLVCERSIYLLRTIEEPRSYLLRTTDGGATWTRVHITADDTNTLLARIVFAGRMNGWAFGEEAALYATRDGGATWTRQRVPTRHLLLGGSFLDASRGWLVGANATVLQTSDGGATWTGGSLNLPGTRFNAVAFVDARRGWIVGAGGIVLHTMDSGRTWRLQPSPVETELFDVKFVSSDEGWAVGAGGVVIHTTDGGARWTAQPSGTTHPLERVSFAGRARGWAVGFGGTIVSYGPALLPAAPQIKTGARRQEPEDRMKAAPGFIGF